ncbi:MAG TPA: hypothetical protein ENI81_08880 [Phycisphaerales bacterium]|nr:hypothetical protein [Phycisphaerales bacterium]
MGKNRDKRYFDILLAPIRVCASYKPKLGRGGKEGISLTDFQRIYREDPFYSWFGLDNPLMYAAHKAAGGMTSIYRQIGIGSETLVRAILQDELGLSEEQAKWSYKVIGANKKERRLSLDARIPLDAVALGQANTKIRTWMGNACRDLDVESGIADRLQGIVFEVRQGYKSKDSKRQNADIANAATAYTQAYLPCVLVMSSQIDTDILHRYRSEKWAILTGRLGESSSLVSTYAFMRDVVGYDLASFFKRNKEALRKEVAKVLRELLRAE